MHNLPGFAGHLVCSLLAAVGAFVRPGMPRARQIQRNTGRLTGCRCSRSTHRPEPTAGFKSRGFVRVTAGILLFACSILSVSPAVAATPPGTIVSNVARVEYQTAGVPAPPEGSNPAVFITRAPASIEFLTPAPDLDDAVDINVPQTFYSTSGVSAGPFAPLLPILPGGLSNPVKLTQATAYHSGQPMFIQLTDFDQNLDPATAETVEVQLTCVDTGDIEWLRLTETGQSTGQFAGYMPTTTAGASSGNGTLSVVVGCQVDVFYTDPVDGTDTTASSALVDPTGIVFDSTNGQPLDGATVTLINDSTGLPAAIFGDDGVSSFPATVITGGSATDSGGTVYNFPPGRYRFPLIAPGDYRLDVIPPAGYSMPTTVSDAVLQTLPGAPFDLAIGSRGEVFTVNPGPVVRIDVPVDPQGDGLWLQKQTNREDATVGDFLQYRLALTNQDASVTETDVVITDRLPTGFRYQRGSTKINDLPFTDPQISPDGHLLQFSLGDIAPAQRVEVSYVIEVTAGTPRGEAINSAQAESAGGQLSNMARATVNIEPLFFDSTSFLAGRVLTGSCEQPDTEMSGVDGVRIYLEDGSYIVTDAQGRYHFEGIEPGVHVVQVDTTSLPSGYEMLPCEHSSQKAGRTFSQFVDLQGGTLWRVNFYTAPKAIPSGEVGLQMSAKLDEKLATFNIELSARTIPAKNLKLTIMLPGNAIYQPGTAMVDGQPMKEPDVIGGAVTMRIGQLSADQTKRISVQAQLDSRQGSGELPAKAMLIFDTATTKGQRTPIVETRFHLKSGAVTEGDEIKLYPRFPSFVAKLQDTDLAMLEQMVARLDGQKIVQADIVGHTDSQPIAPRSRNIFADNQALSEARAQSVADYLRQHLDIPEGILTVRGLGENMPVADNRTASGKALNRRVELNLVTAGETRPGALSLVQAISEQVTVTTKGADPTVSSADVSAEATMTIPQPPQIDAAWRASAEQRAKLVWPPAGYVPETPSMSVMIQYLRGGRVNLELNGSPVNPLNFEGVESQSGSDLLVAVWHGVDLRAGQNKLNATVIDKQGQVTDTFTRDIWFVEDAARVELLEEKSKLLADGLHSPVLTLRLSDEQGHPLRPGLYSKILVDPPYQTLLAQKQQNEEPGNHSAQRFATGPNGLVQVVLAPTSRAGKAVLHVPLSNGTTRVIEAWLKPAPRDWILVGFAQGTVGYNDLSGNQVSLEEAGIEEHYYDDGRVKFFAKGAIKGDWLLTMAYDSDRPDLDGDSLHQVIDPDTYYPLYGDGTNQRYEAASASDIYIKLEKDQAYAVFGDMNTDLNQTELAKYNRNLNGLKVEQQSELYSVKAFAAETKQSFVKDEIRGDGTSGRYQLSQKDIVINSDQVDIETRGRLHSEVIISSQTLTRHTDYEIDYNTGTLYFKRPIPSKDEDFNPVYIVVRYEVDGTDGNNYVYGGRAAIKLLDDKVEVGATYVHEEQGQDDGDLYAVDSTIELADNFELHVEVARTETEVAGTEADGEAYLVELTHESEKTSGIVYYREQDENFGLGQLNDSEEGMRKYGAAVGRDISSNVTVSAEIFHEENLTTDAKRDVAEASGTYNGKGYKLRAGARHVEDKLDDGTRQQSTQALAGVDWSTSIKGVTMRADFEQSLASNNESEAYPTLLNVGADYQVNRNIRLFADQEFTWGDENDTEATRAGIAFTPWTGGSIETSVEQQVNENGQRVFALFGLDQTWQVNERWAIDASLDRSYSVKSIESDSVNSSAPAAHGTEEDFTSVSIGATYRAETWTWNNRVETRQADSENKYGISSRIVAEVEQGVAVSAKASAYMTEPDAGKSSNDGEISLGMAYRPDDSRWIILERFDFEFENEENFTSRRIINHIHANWYMNRKVQFSLYSGVKYVYDTIGGQSYDGVTDMHAAETRYNINSRWDIGAHASWLHSWNSGTFDYAAGISVGYLVRTNTWVSLGYNFKGFEDADFDAAQYTAEGPYMRFRMKFDQQSVREAAEWLNQ